jgi:hypothetical protein
MRLWLWRIRGHLCRHRETTTEWDDGCPFQLCTRCHHEVPEAVDG